MPILLIPILFLLLSAWQRFTAGPFWLGLNNDPAYLYLMNSLYLADGKVPTFIQHPGTIVQMMGASVLKIVSGFKSSESLVENVLRQPEIYLTGMWLVCIVLTTIALVILGRAVYQATGNWVNAAWVQSGILLLFVMYRSLDTFLFIPANVSAETLLMPCVVLWLAWIFKAYRDELLLTQWLSVTVLGVLLGIMLAIKVTSMPFVLVSLCLVKHMRSKVLLIAVIILTFLVGTMPIWSQYPGVYNYLKAMMINKGLHGTGEQGFMDPKMFIVHLRKILEWQWLLALATIGMSIVIMRKGFSGKPHHRRIFLLISGLVLLTFIMVTKEPVRHYLGPVSILFGTIIFAIITYGGIKIDFARRGLVIWVFLMTSIIVWSGCKTYQDSRTMINFSQSVYAQYNACVIAGYYRSSSVNFALQFGDDNAGRKAYGEVIKKIYPQHVFYQLWDKRFDNSAGIVYAQDILNTAPCLVLYGSLKEHESILPPLIESKLLKSAGLEGVFAVTQSTDRQAREALMLSKVALMKNEFQASYMLALQAHAMGLPEAKSIVEMIEAMVKKSEQNK